MTTDRQAFAAALGVAAAPSVPADVRARARISVQALYSAKQAECDAANDHAAGYANTLVDARAECDRLREALEKCQYADNSGEEYAPCCPICQGYITTGHTKVCPIPALLSPPAKETER